MYVYIYLSIYLLKSHTHTYIYIYIYVYISKYAYAYLHTIKKNILVPSDPGWVTSNSGTTTEILQPFSYTKPAWALCCSSGKLLLCALACCFEKLCCRKWAGLGHTFCMLLPCVLTRSVSDAANLLVL